MTLLNDVARCNQSACPRREKCIRWLARDTGDPRSTPISHPPPWPECGLFLAERVEREALAQEGQG